MMMLQDQLLPTAYSFMICIEKIIDSGRQYHIYLSSIKYFARAQ